jgi:predicted MFS family arabinose efflux permease
MLPVLTVVTSVRTAGVIYLTYLSLQVMAEPALESFIMDSVLPEERNTVASLRYMTLFSVQALAVLASGFAIARFGYSSLLVALALLGIAASAAFYSFFQLRRKSPMTHESNVPAPCPLH